MNLSSLKLILMVVFVFIFVGQSWLIFLITKSCNNYFQSMFTNNFCSIQWPIPILCALTVIPLLIPLLYNKKKYLEITYFGFMPNRFILNSQRARVVSLLFRFWINSNYWMLVSFHFRSEIGEINWTVPAIAFPRMTRLLSLSSYKYSALLGFIVSVGGLTESLVSQMSPLASFYIISSELCSLLWRKCYSRTVEISVNLRLTGFFTSQIIRNLYFWMKLSSITNSNEAQFFPVFIFPFLGYLLSLISLFRFDIRLSLYCNSWQKNKCPGMIYIYFDEW